MATDIFVFGTDSIPEFTSIPGTNRGNTISVNGVTYYWNGLEYTTTNYNFSSTTSTSTTTTTPQSTVPSAWDAMDNNPALAMTVDTVPYFKTSTYINVTNKNGIGTTPYQWNESLGKYVPTQEVEAFTNTTETNNAISSLFSGWYTTPPLYHREDKIMVGALYSQAVEWTWVPSLNRYIETSQLQYYTFDSNTTVTPTTSDTSSATTLVAADAYELGDNGAVSDTAIAAPVYTADDLYVMSLDTRVSGNATVGRQLKRMELSYAGTTVKFAVNPSDYTQKEPNRVSITQTKGGAWIDAWGAGITEFTIKGITGVSGDKKTSKGSNTKTLDYVKGDSISNQSSIEVGYQRWKQLRDLFRSVYNAVVDGQEVTELIKLYNYTDNEFWYCYPTQNGIELYRSKSKPHVYQYTISLWGLRRIGEPSSSTGVVGNPNKADTTSNAASGDEIDTEENTDTGEDTGVLSDVEDAPGNGTGNTTVNGATNTESSDDTNTGVQTNPSTTNSTSNSTVQGGTAYQTTAAALDTQADVTTITNTRTKSNASLREWSENHSIAMAPIIGGYEGLLVPTTAYFTAKDLEITAQGMILHLNDLTKADVPTQDNPYSRLLEEMRFAPMVAPATYQMQQLILSYSPTVLTPDLMYPVGNTPIERIMETIEVSKYYGSTLYEYIEQYKSKYYLTKTDIKYLKTIMLDSMTLYYHLDRIAKSTGRITTPITLSNITVLIRNVQALIMYLDLNKTEQNDFYVQNVIWELRQLEYILHQVKTDVIEYL